MYFGSDSVRQEVPGFSVSLLTPALCAEDVPLHTHDNASFVLVLSGAYRSSADGAGQVNSGPMLIFNPAGTTHRDSFVLAHGRFLAISISDESLRVALGEALLPSTAQASTAGAGLDIATRLARECAAAGAAANATMEAMCWELLAEVSGVSLWPGINRSCGAAWIGKARELLWERCSDTLQIGEMAQELGVHPVYFARAFRQVFRCTPGEYRLRCRLREAFELMRSSSLPLAEIAVNAGFFDQSHFSSAFRQHFGMAPQAYRKQMRGGLVQGEVQSIQDKAQMLRR